MFAQLPRAILAAWCLCLGVGPAAALDLSQRSVSGNKQFLVYSEDATLRHRVASFAQEMKAGVLQLVGEADRWKYPIVITLQRAALDRPDQAPAMLQLIQSESGFKVQIDVRIGADPTEVNLQRHVVRALFLEFAYRQSPELLEDGQPFMEAPWWLVEGTLQAFRLRETGPETQLFQRILDVNRLPPLQHLLAPRVSADGGGATAQAVDNACALCLLQLLLEQPTGRAGLAAFVRHLPTPASDPFTALRRDFPTLGATPADLQKWWTLNLARLAAADRYKGLSPEQTDAQLAALLQFEIAGNKGAPARSFGIGDFSEYLKLEASRAVLTDKHRELVALSTRGNALYAEILADYEQIFFQLIRGKSHGLKERLVKVDASREFLLRRKAEIADYLNWFEATQMETVSRAFEGYLKVARELAAPRPRRDPVSEYLDEVGREF